MEQTFKVGDRIKCVNADRSQIDLKVGEVYTVSELSNWHNQSHVYLEGKPRFRQLCYRFVLDDDADVPVIVNCTKEN